MKNSKITFKREYVRLMKAWSIDTIVHESKCERFRLYRTDTGFSDCDSWWWTTADEKTKSERFPTRRAAVAALKAHLNAA